MEEQAASMMVTMIGKGAETTVKLAGKSVDVLAKMAAFLLSLWQKSSLKGQVTMAKLLKSGGPLSAITMDNENYEKFVTISKDHMKIQFMNRKKGFKNFIDRLTVRGLLHHHGRYQYFDCNSLSQ